MTETIINKKLSINYLSDDMLKCAIEKGYKIPCVSIKHHYGKPAIFIQEYENGKVINNELQVMRKDGFADAIYCMNA